jgi:broad specificity phosphatase PhoE
VTRELCLVRHGHCEKSGTLLGQCDVPLTTEGLAQAQALAAELAACGADRLVSSDLQRALQTATALAARLDLPLETDPRLREISYGSWDGLTWTEIECLDPTGAPRKLADWTSWTPPGGEPFDAFIARVRDARASLAASPARFTIVVAHRGVNAVLSGQPLDTFQQQYGTALRVLLP